MTEACEVVTEYWFSTPKFPVLRVPKAVANMASRRISEKEGMRVGVITLKGDVDRPAQRAAMEKTASSLPGVQQVVNELDVKGAKRHAPATQD